MDFCPGLEPVPNVLESAAGSYGDVVDETRWMGLAWSIANEGCPMTTTMMTAATWIQESLTRLEALEQKRQDRESAIRTVEQQRDELVVAHRDLFVRLNTMRQEGHRIRTAMGEVDQARSRLDSSLKDIEGEIRALYGVLEAVAEEPVPVNLGFFSRFSGWFRGRKSRAVLQGVVPPGRESLEMVDLSAYVEEERGFRFRWGLGSALLLLTTLGVGGVWAHTQGLIPPVAQARVMAGELLQTMGLSSAVVGNVAADADPGSSSAVAVESPVDEEEGDREVAVQEVPAEPEPEPDPEAQDSAVEPEKTPDDSPAPAPTDAEPEAVAPSETDVGQPASSEARTRKQKRSRRKGTRPQPRAEAPAVDVPAPKPRPDSVRVGNTRDPLGGLK